MRRLLDRVVVFTVLGLLAATVGLLATPTAGAVPQTGGHDLSAWANNWNWRYNRTFHYQDANGTNVTVNESVLYTNTGIVSFMGQDAYKIVLSGTVSSGSGTACSGGTGPSCTGGTSVSLSFTSGSITGTYYQRVSDLALIQAQETQVFTGTADGIAAFSATFDTTQTPTPASRGTDFRLHPGDTWSFSTQQVVTGSFSYNAGSFGSGSSPINTSSTFAGTATVSSTTVSPPIASGVAVDFVHNSAPDGTVDDEYWAPAYDNLAQQHTVAPSSDGSVLTLDRTLTAASTPTPPAALTENLSSNLACAGAPITVSGVLSTGVSGQATTIDLDESAITPGQTVAVTTTTGAGGAYSGVIAAPALADGLAKDSARASWGIVVRAGAAVQVATLVVTPQDCSSIAYTGTTSAQQGATVPVSAVLTDVGTGLPVNGAIVTFALSGQGGTVTGTTNASGVATANLLVQAPFRAATITASTTATSTLTAASTSSPFMVTVDPTQTVVTSSSPSATVGDSINFTASVAPVGASVAVAPTGTVQFSIDGSALGGPVALNPTASATSINTNSLGIGTHDVVAIYSGDGNYAPSTSPTFHQIVHKVLTVTQTGLTSSVNPTVFGQATTLTATVSATGGGTPTGGVTFKDGATTIGTATLNETPGNDQAALVLATLPVGVHHLTATYGSDDNFAVSSSAPTDQTVQQAQTTTSITPSVVSPVSGQAESFQINVNPVAPGDGSPGGTVQLAVDGVNTGGPATVSSGVALVPVSSLAAGSHTISATYSGDPSFAGSTGTLNLTVAKADTTTTLLTSPNPSVDGHAVTLTATVVPVAPGAGTPTGLVTFTEGTTVLGGATIVSGPGGYQATIGLSNLSVGDHVIVATYGGDGNDNGSASAPVTQTVVQAPPVIDTTMALVASANPSAYGQGVTFTATVAAADATTPTGTVQFSVDGTNLGGAITLNGSGAAVSPAIATLPAGGHTVVASYSGDIGYAESGQVRSQTVKQATTSASVTSNANPAAYGQVLSFTANLTAVAPGAGVPAGSVQFMLDGNPLGTPVATSGGHATSPAVPTQDPGHHTVSIVTTGDPNFKGTTASLDQLVNTIPTLTTLTATPNPVVYGQPLTLTATVAGSGPGDPTGTVTFRDGSTVIGSGPLSNTGSADQAQLITSALAAGPHALTATYGGDVRFSASAASATVTVAIQQAPTALVGTPAVLKVVAVVNPNLTISLNVSLLTPLKATLTANGVPVVGQPVVFTATNTVLCTSTTNAQGVATCNQVSVAGLLLILTNLGYHMSFAGGPNYLPSTGSAGLVTVN